MYSEVTDDVTQEGLWEVQMAASEKRNPTIHDLFARMNQFHVIFAGVFWDALHPSNSESKGKRYLPF